MSKINILNTLITNLPENVPVRSVLVGAHWTVVCSRYCGMAASLKTDYPHRDKSVRDVGKLHLKSARELAELALSDNLMEASIGLATINSVLEVDESNSREINASEYLASHGQGKNIALVGHFPFIPQLRPFVGQLWVIEQNPRGDDYPAEAAKDLIPQADIVAITSCTLINHTLDALLELCPPQATIMLLGPSTPLSPILFNYGVNIISGTRIIDEKAMIRTVEQGASFRQVQGRKLLTFRNQKGIRYETETH